MVDFATIGSNMWEAFLHIVEAPFQDLSIWWYLFPILALWFTLEFYFGIYKSESMGWNTALGNAFSFAWVNIEGMRVLFQQGLDLFWIRFIVLFLAILYSGLVIYLVFTHKIKDKYAFLAASPHLTYYLSAVSILWMHSVLVLDFWVVIDLIILLVITVLVFTLIKKLLPDKAIKRSDDSGYEKFGFGDDAFSTKTSTASSKKASRAGAKSSATKIPTGSSGSKDSSSSGSPMDFLNFK